MFVLSLLGGLVSIVMILGVGIVSIWDGFRNDFTFWQFFLRFVMIFTIYKIYDMTFFDYFLLCKFHFFPHVGAALLRRRAREITKVISRVASGLFVAPTQIAV